MAAREDDADEFGPKGDHETNGDEGAGGGSGGGACRKYKYLLCSQSYTTHVFVAVAKRATLPVNVLNLRPLRVRAVFARRKVTWQQSALTKSPISAGTARKKACYSNPKVSSLH